MRYALLVSLLVLLAVGWWGRARAERAATAEASRSAQSEFVLPLGSFRPVLSLHIVQPQQRAPDEFALFRDGRLAMQRWTRDTVAYDLMRMLTEREVDALLRIAIDGGLVEYDPAAHEDLFRTIEPSTESTTTVISLRLGAYRPDGRTPWRGVDVVHRFPNLFHWATQRPDIEVVQTAARLRCEAERYRQTAVEQDNAHKRIHAERPPSRHAFCRSLEGRITLHDGAAAPLLHSSP
ncbi:MAG: hypothetical protein AAF772_08035 [Acidobacteriota bacterium]